MDTKALIAQLSLDAELIRTRVSKIVANIHSNESPQGGALNIETLASISGATDKTEECTATVAIKITGFPKGTNKDSEDDSEAIFGIHVVVQGVYRLKGKVPRNVLRDQNFAYSFGRPIYLLAAAEVRAIAVKMGLPGVKPASDLPRPDDKNNAQITAKDRELLGSVEIVKKAPARKPRAAAKPREIRKPKKLPALNKPKA